jgi:prevent-host-death family protein
MGEPAEVNIQEAKTHLSRLIARVGTGEEITISRAGRPVARLVPPPSVRLPRTPGRPRGRIEIAEDFDERPDDPGCWWPGRAASG